MSFKHKKLNIRGVQYHPESIMTEFGKEIIKNWVLEGNKGIKV
jgi:anthranilate synthase component II